MGELRHLGDITREFANHLRATGNPAAASWQAACADACDVEWISRILNPGQPSQVRNIFYQAQDHT